MQPSEQQRIKYLCYIQTSQREREMEVGRNRSTILLLWAHFVMSLVGLVIPTSSSHYIGHALVPHSEGVRDGKGQRMQHEQPFPIDNDSLFVDISNNMEETDSDSVINVDCIAESSSREPLDFLGHGIVKPKQAVIYYMNLRVFTPDIVSCTFEWSGKKKTLDMYDNRNLELQYKYVRWSVMENGFSLYHPVSERFHLYKTWT